MFFNTCTCRLLSDADVLVGSFSDGLCRHSAEMLVLGPWPGLGDSPWPYYKAKASPWFWPWVHIVVFCTEANAAKKKASGTTMVVIWIKRLTPLCTFWFSLAEVWPWVPVLDICGLVNVTDIQSWCHCTLIPNFRYIKRVLPVTWALMYGGSTSWSPWLHLCRMRSPNPAEVSRGSAPAHHDPAKSQSNTTTPCM